MFDAFFVILGASLWATDTIFRHPLVNQISPIVIVWVEHIIATFVALGIILVQVYSRQQRRNFWRCISLPLPLLLGTAMVGLLGSAIATLLFTYSFHFINPTISILLQKLQPIVVIVLSALFLKETLPRYFWFFASAAFVAAFFLGFPHGYSIEVIREADKMGLLFAWGAAFFWAIATVAGKSLLGHQRVSSSILSFWRFFFGLLGMTVLVLISPQAKIDLPFILIDADVLKSLAYMAIIPGFCGVYLYYRGLAKVPASVATILELSFPLCAILINTYYLKLPLEKVQLFAGAVLLSSIVALSLPRKS